MLTIPRPEDTFILRLNRAILACQHLKRITDKKNKQMLRSYTGNYHSSFADSRMQPLSMIHRVANIWLPSLVSGNPKCVIEPIADLSLKPFAYTFQLAQNQWIQDQKFDKRILKPVTKSSFFSRGVVKIGTARHGSVTLDGQMVSTGEPFAESVSDVNYVWDITARDKSQREFEGDIYVLPTDEAKEMFSKFADNIKSDFNLWGSEDPKTLENPDKIPYNELREYSRFIDVYLPKERVIITILPPEIGFTKILRTMPYKGPEDGPYEELAYDYIDGSGIPIPPICHLMELDTVMNTMFTKAREGAERLKKLGVYEGGDEGDAKKAKDAAYGDMIGMNNAAAVKELTLGGVVPEIWDFLAYAQSQFSEQAGITGLDYRSRGKTLGQEKMLMGNAMRTLDYMSQEVDTFASNIMRKLAFEMWRNPTFQIQAVMKIAGIGEAAITYNQLQQQGEFPDYRFSIEAYSMQRLNPEERLQRMMQLLTSWILPTMQISMQQGKTPNIPQITEDLSLYADMDTESWFLSEPGMSMNQGGMGNYQPTGQMSTKPRSSDQRFGASESDNMNNFLQQQQASQGA